MVVAFPMVLGGCVAVWGGSYQVKSQTPDNIVIDYDTNFIDDAGVMEIANAHCLTEGKGAVLQTVEKSWGLANATYLCEKPADAPK